MLTIYCFVLASRLRCDRVRGQVQCEIVTYQETVIAIERTLQRASPLRFANDNSKRFKTLQLNPTVIVNYRCLTFIDTT